MENSKYPNCPERPGLTEVAEECPRCGRIKLKDLKDLSRDEQIAAEAQIGALGFTQKELRDVKFCTNCGRIAIRKGWSEET